MGFNRNGARLFLTVVAKACKLSRLAGFEGGLRRILGNEDATRLLAVWAPFCFVVDSLLALDNWYNKRDHVDETTSSDSEDGTSG